MKFGFDLPSGYRGDRRLWTDGRRRQAPEHGYTISSPCEPDDSDELISKQNSNY